MLSTHKIIRIIFFFFITIVISSSVIAQQPSDTAGCCNFIRGNINHDINDNIDISDIVFLVDYMFSGKIFIISPIKCSEEADVNGNGSLGIDDLVHLVSFMFNDGPAPAYCDFSISLLAGTKIIITMEEVDNGTNKELHLNYRTYGQVDCHYLLHSQLIISGNYIYVAFDSSSTSDICVGFYTAGSSDNLGELANSTYSLTINNGLSVAMDLIVTNEAYEITGYDERQFIINNLILSRTP